MGQKKATQLQLNPSNQPQRLGLGSLFSSQLHHQKSLFILLIPVYNQSIQYEHRDWASDNVYRSLRLSRSVSLGF